MSKMETNGTPGLGWSPFKQAPWGRLLADLHLLADASFKGAKVNLQTCVGLSWWRLDVTLDVCSEATVKELGCRNSTNESLLTSTEEPSGSYVFSCAGPEQKS